MSASPSSSLRRHSITHLARLKQAGTPVVALTCYTAPLAALLDETVDVLLVGDSLGMVLYGMESTLPVTLPMMIAHGKAVARGSKRALVVVDMPFGSTQESPEHAFRNAAQVMQETGCQAVKLEGGEAMAPTIAFLTERGIPVMAHIALTPQSVHQLGGYGYRGKTDAERDSIRRDALAVQAAGAFAVVLEGTEEPLARALTQELSLVTIGIGASPACDGQVLVLDDMLGLTPRAPRFVKRYAALESIIQTAAAAYAEDVRVRRFPGPEHCFGVARKL